MNPGGPPAAVALAYASLAWIAAGMAWRRHRLLCCYLAAVTLTARDIVFGPLWGAALPAGVAAVVAWREWRAGR